MSNCYCCVPQCRSWIKRNPELSFHVFPTAGKSKVFVNTEIGGKELVDRRKVWIQKLKMGKRVSNFLRVCSLHFNASDFFLKEKVKRRRLKSNAVPSKNLPVGVVPSLSLKSTTRTSRNCGSKVQNTSNLEETEIREQVSDPCENTLDFEDVEDREVAEALLALMTSHKDQDHTDPSHRDFNVQVNMANVLTLCELISTDEKLKNFTGMNDFVIIIVL